MKSSAPSLEILSQTLKNYRLKQGNKQKQARVVQPVKCLNDLVTDPAVHDLVADAVHMAKNLSKVRFKFAERLRPNSRVACLFSGAPGTGKSMAAEVIAKETNRELWVLDYSSFMSPYVGETEHNLTKIFEAAALADAVILFDEAETFLKNRIQLSNSYEIKIVNHIINLMESFKGIIVMTTNHPEVIDPAFERRFDIKVAFPLPSKPQMISLLKKMLEPDAPLEEGFDYDQVVDGIELSGGNIRNAIERAVMKMERKEDAVLSMTDVREALLEIQSQLHVITDSKPIIGIKNT
jgi:SpoVK/Ycf46/Vps4 family AAA+-type ATPase